MKKADVEITMCDIVNPKSDFEESIACLIPTRTKKVVFKRVRVQGTVGKEYKKIFEIIGTKVEVMEFRDLKVRDEMQNFMKIVTKNHLKVLALQLAEDVEFSELLMKFRVGRIDSLYLDKIYINGGSDLETIELMLKKIKLVSSYGATGSV